MKSHPEKIIIIFLILMFILSGCGSLATRNLYSDFEERKRIFCHRHYECKENPSVFLAIPYVYSGAKLDLLNLADPFFCGWSTGEAALVGGNIFYILIWPFIAVDFVLSVALDTLMLPYTIPMQFTKGNLIDPPYFAIAEKYYRKNNFDEAIAYYEKGMQILPKYYDDNIEAERYFFDLDDYFYDLAQLYEIKENYAKTVYSYEQLIELTKATHGSPGSLETYYRLMGDVYTKAGNAVKADECHKTAKEYKKLAKEEYENYLKKKYGNLPQKEKEEKVAPDKSAKKENKLPSSFVIDNGKLINQELAPLTPLSVPPAATERESLKGQSVKKF